MPELPEVETMRRGILPIVGALITDIQRTPCSRRPIQITPRIDRFRRKIEDRYITAIHRRGKRVAVQLEDESYIVLEPRMTGLVLLCDPPTTEHLRICFTLDECEFPELLYWDRRGLGLVYHFSADEFQQRYSLDRLGPDALEVDAEMLRERFRNCKREIKVALLDQKLLAGVGNLYASEILFVAGVHPQRRCDRLTKDQWQRIQIAMQQVLNEAIRCEGSTLGDGTYRTALNQTGNYQNKHQVYNRVDKPCPRCNRPILQITQAQRSTFFCKRCQLKN